MTNDKLIELLNELSVEEKIGQLVQVDGSFFSEDGEVLKTGPVQEMNFPEGFIKHVGSLLGTVGAKQVKQIQKLHLETSKIPLIFMTDVIHGYKTIFPIPLALGATWNPEMIELSAHVAAKEAVASGVQVNFSPMVDVVRDPRWGRVMESTGEDTFLNTVLGQAFVDGYQKDNNMYACVKHFAGYGAAEGGRDYNTVDISEIHLREFYLPPFKKLLQNNCKMVMNSFNVYEQVPSSINQKLSVDILRNEWKYDDVLITDHSSFHELFNHGIVDNDTDAAKLGINATNDIEMMSSKYANGLIDLAKNDPHYAGLVDKACYRVLKLKNDLGLFENPYINISEEAEAELFCSKEHLNSAYQVASEAVTLLKNEKNILPLKNNAKIAIIGPLANTTDLFGSWSDYGDVENIKTIKEAITKKFSAALFAQGCTTTETNSKMLSEATNLASKSETVLLFLGEESEWTGESNSKHDIRLPKAQRVLFDEIYKVNKNIILCLSAGRPLEITNQAANAQAIVYNWFLGTKTADVVADVLLGNINPSGKLPMTFPKAIGQIPMYYNHYRTGRPQPTKQWSRYSTGYLDIDNNPLYPFGYGLTYSKVEINNFEVTTDRNLDSDILVKVAITNMSETPCKEVVQIYINDVIASTVRPVKQLKAFKKIDLASKESKIVELTIKNEDLYMINNKFENVIEPGKFKVYAGLDSDVTKYQEVELKQK